MLKQIAIFSFLFLTVVSCTRSQSSNTSEEEATLVGAPCEGCEAVFEYGDRILKSVDTLPDFHNPGTKIKITGTIYQADGETPAEGVVLYVYHTNQEGIYEAKEEAKGWGRSHGYIRGWVQTDKSGRYAFYTLRPGSYPSGNSPEHIHPIILEPNRKYYYIQDYLFEDDPNLTEHMRRKKPRGGTDGVLKLEDGNGLLVAHRDIILGRNVPGYH